MLLKDYIIFGSLLISGTFDVTTVCLFKYVCCNKNIVLKTNIEFS
jgi:hypothetical protein